MPCEGFSPVRRRLLKLAAVSPLFWLAGNMTAARAAASGEQTMLVLYFSRTGNTRTVARMIHERVGGDLVELDTVTPYPQAYETLLDVSREEQRRDARPAIRVELPRWEQYQTIFVGFPNWWGSMPMPFFTFFTQYAAGRRNVAPFCTHGGSGLGHSQKDLRRLCPEANLLEGLAIRGTAASGAQPEVDHWLRRLGYAR